MQFSLRRNKFQQLALVGQFALLMVGMQVGTRWAWLASLSLTALLSLLAWQTSLRRLRAIRDTPTSRIASAAQGYVELIGQGSTFGDTPLLSRLRQLPCLWYRYTVEEREHGKDGDSWRTLDSGESYDSFILRDDTGMCVVDPVQAEISTTHHEHWERGDLRYTEWILLKNDTIYVLGEFRTRNGIIEFDSNAELNALLTEWKKDMPALHKRFDLNNDGELDMAEWMLARKAAKREISKKKLAVEAQPDLNIISQPSDGKLYLISNLTPEALSRRHLYWGWVYVIIFFLALAAMGWILENQQFLN